MKVEKQDANLELTQSSLFLSDEAGLCFIFFYSTPADDRATLLQQFQNFDKDCKNFSNL